MTKVKALQVVHVEDTYHKVGTEFTLEPDVAKQLEKIRVVDIIPSAPKKQAAPKKPANK